MDRSMVRWKTIMKKTSQAHLIKVQCLLGVRPILYQTSSFLENMCSLLVHGVSCHKLSITRFVNCILNTEKFS